MVETTAGVVPFHLERLGVIMSPEQGNPLEVEGVLNPACTRGPDGELYLLPRLVGARNYSRIGLARVLFRDGDPVGVQRLGVALEPQEAYERSGDSGGCEDPRVTYVPQLKRYVLTYTAWGPRGPRIAAAVSRNLGAWRRLGLVRFDQEEGIDFGAYDDKDALLFPEPVPDPQGRPSLAMIHRPMYRIMEPDGLVRDDVVPPEARDRRQSMWISYCPLEGLGPGSIDHPLFNQHTLLAAPEQPWERTKIGGGTPPIRTDEGWLVFYHGVEEDLPGPLGERRVRYSAGVLLLDPADPRRVLYRSRDSILAPGTGEATGVVPGVVFPTGVDVRENGRIDIYYGMADYCIGVARTTLPHLLAAPTLHVSMV